MAVWHISTRTRAAHRQKYVLIPMVAHYVFYATLPTLQFSIHNLMLP